MQIDGEGGTAGLERDEQIADDGEDRDETLQASRGSKPLPRTLAFSERHVRILGIGSELVGDHAPGRPALLLGVAPNLHKFIQNITVLVDGAP